MLFLIYVGSICTKLSDWESSSAVLYHATLEFLLINEIVQIILHFLYILNHAPPFLLYILNDLFQLKFSAKINIGISKNDS